MKNNVKLFSTCTLRVTGFKLGSQTNKVCFSSIDLIDSGLAH